MTRIITENMRRQTQKKCTGTLMSVEEGKLHDDDAAWILISATGGSAPVLVTGCAAGAGDGVSVKKTNKIPKERASQ